MVDTLKGIGLLAEPSLLSLLLAALARGNYRIVVASGQWPEK